MSDKVRAAFHGAEPATCPECGADTHILERHNEQVGHEEKARPIVVTDLACGHSIERPGTWT